MNKINEELHFAICARLQQIADNVNVCYSAGIIGNILDHVPAALPVLGQLMKDYNKATADYSSEWSIPKNEYPFNLWVKGAQSFGLLNHIKGKIVKVKTYKSWKGSTTEFQLKEKARIIASTNGGFFSVTYLDKQGNIKNQNARIGVKKDIKGTGKRPDIPNTVLVYKPKKGWRLLYLGHIKAIRACGSDYLFDFQPVTYRT